MARPKTGETPTRYIRIPDDRWEALDVAAKIGSTNRAAIVNELIRWYLDDMGKPAMPRLPIPPRPSAE